MMFLIVVCIWGVTQYMSSKTFMKYGMIPLNISWRVHSNNTFYKIQILVRKKIVYTVRLFFHINTILILFRVKAFFLNERSVHTHEGICQKWVETSVVLENNVLKIACWCWMFATLSLQKIECSKQLTTLFLSQNAKLFRFEHLKLGLIKFIVR